MLIKKHLINKCRVIIYIEPNLLRYVLLESVKQPFCIDNETMIEYPYQNMADIELFIVDLLKNVTGFKIIELNLDKIYIQSEWLTLPEEVKLNINEISLFIEASIYKLFQVSAKDIYFDFTYSHQQPKQIQVAICERQFIDTLINLFSKDNLSLVFIGEVIENGQINFLPWRKTKQKQKKLQLAIVVICFMGIVSCLFGYLWLHARYKLEYYSTQVIDKQKLQQKLAHELSIYLPNPSPSQKQIQQFLLMISKQIPTTIWLETLVYIPQKITLKGHSFSYVQITTLNEDILQQQHIAKSQVTSVTSNKDDLLFELDIKLSEE